MKLLSLTLIVPILAVSLSACGTEDGKADWSSPNIVLIVSDDLGWADMSHRGSDIPTPALDRLAREGVSLSRNYVQPLCTPTRASLMTGRVPIRFGLQYRPLRPWDQHGMPAGEILLSEVLQDAGYKTACVGKWHLGHGSPEQHPINSGFDSFYGLITGAHDYFSHERGGSLDWQRDGVPLHEEGYTTDLLGAEAARFIRRQRPDGQPFFLYLPFNAPHTPLQAPQEMVHNYREKFGERRATYMAMVESMDIAIGGVLTALDESGCTKNTIVLFVNDNGGARIEGASNRPLRGGKGSALEGGIRVPALLRWPQSIGAGTTSSQLVSVQDWMPTLLTAVGVGCDAEFDGRDVLPGLTGSADNEIQRDLFFGSISEKGWYLALINGKYKYLRRILGAGKLTEKLFDVELDPAEKNDLALQMPELLEQMRGRALEWHALSPAGNPVMVTEAPDGWSVPADWSEASRP